MALAAQVVIPPTFMTVFWCFRCGFHDAVAGGTTYASMPVVGSRGHRNADGYFCIETKLTAIRYDR